MSAPNDTAEAASPPLTWLQGATLSILASLASLTLIGYRFGDSNHGITVPILKRFIDRSLYSSDLLVATGDRFPTVFYRLLAALLPSTDWVPFAYYLLYVVSIALTYAAVYRMGVWASGGDRSAGVLAGLLAMPVRLCTGHLLKEPIPPSRRTPTGIPQPLEALVLACLAKDAADRPPSALALRDSLRGLGGLSPWTPPLARLS